MNSSQQVQGEKNTFNHNSKAKATKNDPEKGNKLEDLNPPKATNSGLNVLVEAASFSFHPEAQPHSQISGSRSMISNDPPRKKTRIEKIKEMKARKAKRANATKLSRAKNLKLENTIDGFNKSVEFLQTHPLQIVHLDELINTGSEIKKLTETKK